MQTIPRFYCIVIQTLYSANFVLLNEEKTTRLDFCMFNQYYSKKKYCMSDHLPELPEDLITDILLRLPVKSIGQFKCVSKHWRSFLSSPQFVRFHLNFQQHVNKGVFVEDKHSFDILTFDNEDTLRNSRNISFPMFNESENKCGIVEDLCDGLVLLRQEPGRARFLVNPITLEAAKVSEMTAKVPDNCLLRNCLGYDSFGDDYKIASAECKYNDDDDTIHLYSVRTKSWKAIEDGDHQYHNNAAGTFVNGCMHWLVYGFTIVSLILSNEKFEEFPLPKALHYLGDKLLTVLGGCLSLVSNSVNRSYDVWVMKEYGKHDSWTKLFSVNLNLFPEIPNPHSFQVVCFLKEDEIALLQINDHLVAYNWRSCEYWEYMTFAGFHDRKLGKATAFTESLLSPSCNW